MDSVEKFYETYKLFPANLKANVQFLLLAGNSMDRVYNLLSPHINNNNSKIKCPRCNNIMVQSKLIDDRLVFYCVVDRVTIPI